MPALPPPAPKTLPNRVPIGATVDPSNAAALFRPLNMRGCVLKNRVVVSPMCQYSTRDGLPTAWHLAHLGAFGSRGPAVVIAEASAVQARGRISPQDTGIWNDEQMEGWKPIAEFIASQDSIPAIQLAHAGRKASSLSPFLSEGQTNHAIAAGVEDGGWPDDVWGPSDLPYSDKASRPKAMTDADIDSLVDDFVAAAKRADLAGFEIIEIHGAHGYLIHSFLSPISNNRTDDYGGSLANRARLLLRILRSVRSAWPVEKSLWLRLSCTDYMEHTELPSFTLNECLALCAMIKKEGLADLIDCSGGGLDARQKIELEPGYQIRFAEAIRTHLSSIQGPEVLVGAVGLIFDAQLADEVVREGKADVVLAAREFMRDAETVLRWAEELGTEVGWAVQYERAKRKLQTYQSQVNGKK